MQPFDRSSAGAVTNIREGMEVYDARDTRIGTVEYIHFGAETEGDVAAEPSAAGVRSNSLVDIFADIFAVDTIPEEVQAQLMQKGFMRIDADGLFAADRYVTLDHVVSVAGDRVSLNVTRDELVKR